LVILKSVESCLHPFSRSTTAPMRSCAGAPAPSPSESGRGTRWSPLAAKRLVRPRTPNLAAHVAVADHQACCQAVLPQPSGSQFQTRWFLCLLLHRRHHEAVLEPFSCLARDRRCLHNLHRCGTRPVSGHHPRGWASCLFSSQLRPKLGGSPVESCLRPWRRSNQSGIL
jgi:hypothetical protein